MTQPLVLVTGFEPFLDVAVNPSGELARLLEREPAEGLEVVGAVLPVSFTHTPPAFEAALAEVRARRPVAILSLGVQRGSWFRLESRARAELGSTKPDAEGAFASEQGKLGERDLASGLDLEALRRSLLKGGALDARISDDAGGYLCERVYYAGLCAGKELGVPALFLHVPPVEAVTVEAQAPVLRKMLVELARQAAAV